MRSRRTFLLTLATGSLAVCPRLSLAQQAAAKVARIGVLEFPSDNARAKKALTAGLRDLGYVEGKNLVMEYRWAAGNYERLAGLAAELVQMNVDVIVGGGTRATRIIRAS